MRSIVRWRIGKACSLMVFAYVIFIAYRSRFKSQTGKFLSSYKYTALEVTKNDSLMEGLREIPKIMERKTPLNWRRRKVILFHYGDVDLSLLKKTLSLHPGVFVINDPLQSVPMKRNKKQRLKPVAYLKAIGHLFNCTGKVTKVFSKFTKIEIKTRCSNSTAIQSSAISKRKKTKIHKQICNKVATFPVERTCHSKHLVVDFPWRKMPLKDMLQHLMKYNHADGGDIRIVHVVSDPRTSIIQHIKKSPESVNTSNLRPLVHSSIETCSRIRRDMNTVHHSTVSPWLQMRRHTVLQAEDLENNLVATSYELYNFLDIYMHSNVLKWLKRKTGVIQERRTLPKIPSLAFDFVSLIQTQCKDILKTLKLPIYHSAGHMKLFSSNSTMVR